MKKTRAVDRREFLKTAALSSAGLGLVGCGPDAPQLGTGAAKIN